VSVIVEFRSFLILFWCRQGVLSKGRADDLRHLPLQEADLLLHEAGAPPIHTPLEVLMKLPPRIKKRLYVVHTSNIPDEYGLRVAPTGTAGTLRLDQLQRGASIGSGMGMSIWTDGSTRKTRMTRDAYTLSLQDADASQSEWNSSNNEYSTMSEAADLMEDTPMHWPAPQDPMSSRQKKAAQRSSITSIHEAPVPLVSLRPASSTDAWFILNLLSSVPFMSR